MNKKAKIIKVINNQAIVEILDEMESSCNHNCGECKSQKKQFVVDTKLNINDGDIVEINVDSLKVSISIIVTFILPIILFILGLSIGGSNNIKGFIFGIIFVAISLFFAYIFDKYFGAKVFISKVLERNIG